MLLKRLKTCAVFLLCIGFIVGLTWQLRQIKHSAVGKRKSSSSLSSPSGVVSMTTTQKQRLQLLQQFCARIKRKIKPLGQQVLYNTQHRFAYCQIGKVASTTWRGILKKLIGDRTPGRRSTQLNAQSLNLRRRIAKGFTFTFVRHPFDRLVSAYVDKFQRKSEYWETLVPKIVRKYRSNSPAHHQAAAAAPPSHRPVSNGNHGGDVTSSSSVSFEEFVQYLVDRRSQPLEDFHWSPQVELCPPCRVRFDFVGHYETFSEDAAYVVSRLGVAKTTMIGGSSVTEEEAAVPSRWKPTNATARAAKIRSLMSQLTRPQINRIIHLYRLDFQAFGYRPTF